MDIGKRLYELKVGEKAKISEIIHTGRAKRRLFELGVISGREVVCIGESPFGDPRAYALCGTVIAIRNKDAADVFLTE